MAADCGGETPSSSSSSSASSSSSSSSSIASSGRQQQKQRFVHLPLTDLTAPDPDRLERMVATVVAALELGATTSSSRSSSSSSGRSSDGSAIGSGIAALDYSSTDADADAAATTVTTSSSLSSRDALRQQPPPPVVYLHCWGGKGRSGTVAAAVLSYLYPDASEASVFGRLDDAFRTRGAAGETPETDEQRAVLRGFIADVKRRPTRPPPRSRRR